MPDPVQTMPSNEAMLNESYTHRQWLQYYKNVWVRNLVARTIDVQSDTVEKAKNPEQSVQHEDGSVMPVKQRLEHRKVGVQDAVELVAAIDALLAIPDDQFTEKCLSKEALAVAEDMKPAPAAAAATAPAKKQYTVLKEGFTVDDQAVPVGSTVELDEATAATPVAEGVLQLIATA